jgi:hypothetical protein
MVAACRDGSEDIVELQREIPWGNYPQGTMEGEILYPN